MYFKSVTFDLDGTLLDTIADLAEGCRLMLEEIGAPQRTPTEVHSFVGKGMAVLIERCLTHGGQPPSSAQLDAAIASFRAHYTAVNGRFSRVYPGVIEGLDAWQASGLKMGIVTNKPAEFTEALIDHVGMRSYFEVIVSGDTTPHKKPHSEPILHACRLLGVDPRFNLHIGDSKNDIDAARAAGCAAYAVPYGYNEGEPVDSADYDALVSDLLVAYQQALTFKDLHQK